MKEKINIFWFRRDLRLDDNAGLYYALRAGLPVLPIFIFDTIILDRLENRSDARVEFIYNSLEEMQRQLINLGSSMLILHGTPAVAFEKLMTRYDIAAVYTNTDYEPYALERDAEIAGILDKRSIPLHAYKDQVILHRDEVLKDDGKPYTVFTPYSRKWRALLTDFHLKPYPGKKYFENFLRSAPQEIMSLDSLGFSGSDKLFPPKNVPADIVKEYAATRDIPGIHGTSHLGLHLRFGTVSIRALTKEAAALSQTFLNELIWRDFYQMILWHFPQVGRGRAFKPAYENIQWRFNATEFAAWCTGHTGYPIVDAGMRELNETGFMHNRVRMIVASFLCKHLLHDWRLGEAYFAEKLLDYDLAANNGGWQWASGSGCDSAPYFRIFNPYLQTKKFDPQFKYIRRWVPEFEGFSYPLPIVDHVFARERCLKVYKAGLNSAL